MTPSIDFQQLRDGWEASQRLRSMARVFARTDTALTGKWVTVQVVDSALDAPMWSDGRDITFNRTQIGAVDTAEDVIALTGGNYHELAHAWYSPRAGTAFRKRIQADGLFPYWNVLEDQRIETLFVARYADATNYFSGAFMKWCLSHPGVFDRQYVLAYGRRFLPSTIRRKLRDMYHQPGKIKLIEMVIDQYRTLPMADDDAAYDLVKLFRDLMPAIPPDMNGHNDRGGALAHGRPLTASEQLADSEAAQALDESFDDSDGSDDSDSSDGEAGSGSGVGRKGKDHHDDMKDELQDELDNIKDDARVRDDIRNKQDVIKHGDGEDTSEILKAKAMQEATVTPSMADIAYRFAHELNVVREDMDPGWEPDQPAGRLNMNRAMRGDDPTRVFDGWQEGNEDSTGIALVVINDISSSLSATVLYEICQATWCIKSGLEALDHRIEVPVFAFESDPYLMYDRGERADLEKFRYLNPKGGTWPQRVIEEAIRLLTTATNMTRLAILFQTDGMWGGYHEAEELIRNARSLGITTALAYYTDDPANTTRCPVTTCLKPASVVDGFIVCGTCHWSGTKAEWLTEAHRAHSSHGCDIFLTIDEPMRLVDLAQLLAERVMQNNGQ